MSNFKISRRQFMTSTGAVFTLPLLESLFPFNKAMAQAANDPKRYVGIYFPNGTCNRVANPIWWTNPGPIGGANSSHAFWPFSANFGDLININGLQHTASNQLGGDEHECSAKTWLTCVPFHNSSTNSFEHVLAARQGKNALVLSGGATNADLPGDKCISFKNGVGDPGISNPGDLYRKLFSSLVPNTGSMAANDNKSVLDSSIADFTSLNATLSKSDKVKMDEFLTSVRSLERTIAAIPVQTNCQAPAYDAQLDNADSRNTPLYLPKFYAMNDMIKIAFACDLTRSVSIMLDEETSNRQFVNAPANILHYGADVGYVGNVHIAISHAIDSELGYNRAVTRDRLYLLIVMDLVNKLKSGIDPSGSRILDNTIINAGFGVTDGVHAYVPNRRPMILAGGRNMLNLGQSHVYTDKDMKDLYFTIARKLGIALNDFQGSTTQLAI